MSVDLAVGTPAFLDLSFLELDGVPKPGEERYASELVRSPGGGAITAIGAARLGLRAALARPLGDDDAGRFVAATLVQEGVEHRVRSGALTPVTAVMVLDGDRAFVTWEPAGAELEWPDAGIVITGLGDLDTAPDGACLYVSAGDADARRHSGRPPAGLDRARALFMNEGEAELLAGAAGPEQALARLGELAETVVITRGAHGALAMVDGRRIEVAATDVAPVSDTTGAGDLFCAAHAWADLRGADPEARLRWATLAASLSVTEATGAAGAVDEATLLEEGARRGLAAPPVEARAGS